MKKSSKHYLSIMLTTLVFLQFHNLLSLFGQILAVYQIMQLVFIDLGRLPLSRSVVAGVKINL